MKTIKTEFKVWSIYFITLLSANFFHELGHCIPAWTHGYSAIPTPAKMYTLASIPLHLVKYESLGGIINSVLFTVLVIIYFAKRSFKYNSAVLAGGIAMPSIYTLRFILRGRGHDQTEFQEAQSALGLSYTGHFIDWLFFISIPPWSRCVDHQIKARYKNIRKAGDRRRLIVSIHHAVTKNK